MSVKRLAVISAVGSHNSFNNQTISYVSSYSGASGSVEQSVIVGHAAGNGGTVRTSGGHHQGLQTMRPGANLHGNVNIMLGGAMLSVVITVVCFVCYCCHRNIKKRSNSIYRQQWLETEANMEIYSVEQCYDPPPSGTGGFFMDGSSTTGDYQSLPMVTSAINHTGHHPQYPYHPQHYHQQQQQQQQHQQQHHYQYTPYPNGPPPSYDTVVAQDELLANVSRRKRTDTRPAAGPSSHNSCSDPETHECDKQSVCPGSAATTPLLPKTATRRSHRRCGVSASNERAYSDDPADEPLCQSGLQELQEWSDTHRDDDGTASCSCPTAASNSVSSINRPGVASSTGQTAVPPIYCRNCGYFVEGSRDSATSPVVQILSPCRRSPADRIDLPHNETLLVDYETIAIETTPAGCSIGGPNDDVNRNNTIEDSGATADTTTTTVDIDMLTMQMMMVASASSTVSGATSTGPTRQLDTVNNNSSTANETKNLRYSIGTVAPDSSTAIGSAPLIGDGDRSWRRTATPSTYVNSENNNIIIDSSTTATTTISPMDHRETPASATSDIIHQCPNTSSNQCCNQPDGYCTEELASSTVEDHTNGNAGDGVTDATTATQPSSGIRSLLNENGLVRLDMSQIIDNTGLPTYEAALKLESSGYV